MPIYCYECDTCGHAEEDFQSIKSDAHTICPNCDLEGYHRVPTLPNTNMKEFQTPIEMYSIGLNDDDEIRAFKQQCPDIDVANDPSDPLYGVPIARTRQQKLAALDQAGFVENN